MSKEDPAKPRSDEKEIAEYLKMQSIYEYSPVIRWYDRAAETVRKYAFWVVVAILVAACVVAIIRHLYTGR